MKKKTYTMAVTLPLTLWVEVKANDEAEARTLALDEALNTPYPNWGDDFSTANCDVVKIDD